MAAPRPSDRQFSEEDEAAEREALGRCARIDSGADEAARGDVVRRAATLQQKRLAPALKESAFQSQTSAPYTPPSKRTNRIVFAFSSYPLDTEAEIARWAANYARLPPRHRALLSASQPAKLAAARAAARTNRHFIAAMLDAFDEENGGGGDGGDDDGGGGDDGDGDERDGTERRRRPPAHLTGARAAAAALAAAAPGGRCPPGDAEKVRYVLKNLARDWSAEGAPERAQSYGRIVEELCRLFPDRAGAAAGGAGGGGGEGGAGNGGAGGSGSGAAAAERAPPRVLVPGAGLGRLMVDLAAAGFAAQGNEFSYFMLMAGSFVLNHSVVAGQWTVHPWMHSNLNHLADSDQLRPVAVPDVLPADVVAPGLLSMCAGDFVVRARPASSSPFFSHFLRLWYSVAPCVGAWRTLLLNCAAYRAPTPPLSPLTYSSSLRSFLPSLVHNRRSTARPRWRGRSTPSRRASSSTRRTTRSSTSR